MAALIYFQLQAINFNLRLYHLKFPFNFIFAENMVIETKIIQEPYQIYKSLILHQFFLFTFFILTILVNIRTKIVSTQRIFYKLLIVRRDFGLGYLKKVICTKEMIY